LIHAILISQYFPPDVNGSSTRAFNVAKGLVSQGCRVTVLSTFPHFPKRQNDQKYSNKLISIDKTDGFTIVRMWIPSFSHSSNISRTLLHLFFCFSTILNSRFVKGADVIFAMNPTFFVGLPSAFFHSIFKIPIIRNVDDLWPEVFYDLGIIKSSFVKKILDYFSKKSYDVSSKIIPISYGYVDTLISKYHIPKSKISVIEHGVDISLFQPKNNHIHNKIFTIIYSGAINIGYDFNPVIQVAKELENYPICFIIKGSGDKINELKNLIKHSGVQNIKVNTAYFEKKNLIDFLNTADVFLLPMNSGVIDSGLPTKILEYQALAKPIICISDGESGKYVNRTNCGLVIKNKDVDELKKSILKLFSDPELRNQLGKNGLTYIEKNLTIEQIGNRLLKLINFNKK